MKKFYCLLVLTIIMVLGAGCGTPMPNSYSIHNTPPNSFPEDVSKIYVFYPENAVAAPCYFKEDGKRVGVIKSGTYFIYIPQKGKHVYSLENDSHIEPKIVIKTELGQTYYLQAGQETDFLIAHPQLEIVSKEVADSKLPFLKYILWYYK